MLNRQSILDHPVRCGAAVFCVLFAGLCGTEITRLDVRFAMMVQDMARHGIGLFGTMNGCPYTDYPSAYVALAYLATGCGHFMNYALLALPTLILSAVMVIAIMRIGEKAAPWAGIAAAGLWLASGGIWDSLMGFGIDVPVAAAGVLMLWLLAQKSSPWRLAAVFAILLIAVFFVRGALGFMVLAAAVGGALLFERRWKELGFAVLSGAVALGISAGAAYALIQHQGGRELLELVLRWQFAARVSGVDGNEYFYYFLNGLPTFSPVGLGAVAGAYFLGKKLRKAPAAGWLGFALVPMLLLSVPGCKHLRYILIAVPALALLAGYGFTQGAIPAVLRQWAEKLFHVLALLLPALTVLALAGMAIAGLILWNWHSLPWLRWGLLAFGIWALYRATRAMEPPPARNFLRLFPGAGMIFALGVFPYLANFESARAFSEKVLQTAPGRISLYALGPDHDDLKFMLYVPTAQRSAIRYVLDGRSRGGYGPAMYRCTAWDDAVPTWTENDWIILQEGKLKRLQERAAEAGYEIEVMQQGSLGHRKALAVRLVPKTQH